MLKTEASLWAASRPPLLPYYLYLSRFDRVRQDPLFPEYTFDGTPILGLPLQHRPHKVKKGLLFLALQSCL
jgi:hypothetical protein